MKKSLTDIFRNNLKYYRKKSELTQERLSESLGKNANYIGLVENGKSIPPIPVIEKIAEALKINPMLLFDEEGCEENILTTGKDEFAKKISDVLSQKLRLVIYDDVRKLL